jgi:6-pyruvoyltetrahydropterin/6-carboxytetrahydropterin synthase
MPEQLFYVAAAPFEAARKVEILPAGHRASKLHGHSFVAKARTEIAQNWVSFDGAEVGKLRDQLATAVEPINYSLLNDHVSIPTDENMARWVRGKLVDIPGNPVIGIQSTAEQGADLDQHDHVHLWRKYRFEAAHQLPNVAEGHKCGRMHGHGFEVIIHVDQVIDDENMGIDFDVIDQHWDPIQDELHHRCLNDIQGLENPTSEMIASWLWARLKPELRNLSWVSVYETYSSGCHFDGTHHRIWKEQRFESACQLSLAPEGDTRRNLHGHSYLIRLHLTAPLDKILGWTVDYGDVKELFKPVYDQLDHHRLDLLSDLSIPSAANILYWAKESMENRMPQLYPVSTMWTI